MVIVTFNRDVNSQIVAGSTITAETVSVIGRDIIVPGQPLPYPSEYASIQAEFCDTNPADAELVYS